MINISLTTAASNFKLPENKLRVVVISYRNINFNDEAQVYIERQWHNALALIGCDQL